MRVLHQWFSDLVIFGGPPIEERGHFVHKSAEGCVFFALLQVPFAHDILGILNAADKGDLVGLLDRFHEFVLVSVSVTFLVWGLAAFTEDGLECSGIEQEPSLNMWVRDSSCNQFTEIAGSFRDLSAAFIPAVTVCINPDNEQIWKGYGFLLLDFSQVTPEFRNSPPRSAGRIPDSYVQSNSILSRKVVFKERDKHLLMGIVFHEEDNPTHRSHPVEFSQKLGNLRL